MQAMINVNDPVYKKHQHCQVELKPSPWAKDQLRCWCMNHRKWLHTLSKQETQAIQGILGTSKGVKTGPARRSELSRETTTTLTVMMT